MLLKTPRPDLPQSIHDHLKHIKALFVHLHPGIADGYLVDMLNAALAPRNRGTTYKETAEQLSQSLFFSPSRLTNLGTSDALIKCARSTPATICKNAIALLALAEDGMHPLATFTGVHMSPDVLEQGPSDFYRKPFYSFIDKVLHWADEYNGVTPFFTSAIECLNDPVYSRFCDQNRIADLHRRYAPLLSKKNDLLGLCWEAGLEPKPKDFSRNGPKATSLMKAIGAITETTPSLATDRVARSDWPVIQRKLWAVGGLVAELDEIRDVEAFIESTLSFPAQITPEALLAVSRIPDHPLLEPMVSRLVKYLPGKEVSDLKPFWNTALHIPSFAKAMGKNYIDFFQSELKDVVQDLDAETLDFALSPIAKAWGHPVPSQDIDLIDTRVSLKTGWYDNHKAHISKELETFFHQHARFPIALISGVIPANVLSPQMQREFGLSLVGHAMDSHEVFVVKDLRERNVLSAKDIIDRMVVNKLGRNTRLIKAYHHQIISADDINAHYPEGLTLIISSDLGL